MPGESGVVPRLEAVFAVIPLKRNPKTGCPIANSQCNGPAEPPVNKLRPRKMSALP